MANLKDVIYLSNEDYETLVSTGTVIISGETLTYDENNIYVTPDKLASATEDGLMSASDKTKLNGIASGAEVNVQSDWSVSDSSSDAFIKNKPTIPAAQVNSDWNASSGVAQILNKPSIPDSDSDLTNDRYIRYDTASQGLTDTQKSNARTNIGAGTSDLTIGTTSTTAAAGDHTHSASITSGGSSPTALSANTTYTLTAGGSTIVFTTPSDGKGVTSVATGVGLTGGTITSTGTIKAKLKDETLNTADSSKSTSTSGGLYSIEADKSGNLAVRVPWSNTNYYAKTTVTGDDKTKIATGYSGSSTSTTYDLYVPNATASQGGIVTTDAQTFAGAKTFTAINVNNDSSGINVYTADGTGTPLYISSTSIGKGTSMSIDLSNNRIKTSATGSYGFKFPVSGGLTADKTIATTDDIPTGFTITANATDGMFDITGTGGTNAVTYAVAPYKATTATSTWVNTNTNGGKLYLGTVNPVKTDRLNFNGNLCATTFITNNIECTSNLGTAILSLSHGDGGSDVVTPGHLTVYGDDDNSNPYKPSDSTNWSTPEEDADIDTTYFNTGIYLTDTVSGYSAKLSFPGKSGTLSLAPESLTYASLVSLKEAGELMPGRQYRITDYQCTTTQDRTFSANHPFDIIVTALDSSTLSEEASATYHVGESYFGWSKVNAWKIWYCLDNDTDRFMWADATNGKGVIYRMIDEFGNDCPYDFKNIMMDNGSADVYTFTKFNSSGDPIDASLTGASLCFNNRIDAAYVMPGSGITKSQMFLPEDNFVNPTAGATSLGCSDNHIHCGCELIRMGSNCRKNIFYEGCVSIQLGSNSMRNVFSCSCSNIKLGSYCIDNVFGSFCSYVYFGTSSSSIINYCANNIFDNNTRYVYFYSSDTTASSSNRLQNVHVHLGVVGSSSAYKSVVIPDRALAYETDVYLNTNGNLIYYVNNH